MLAISQAGVGCAQAGSLVLENDMALVLEVHLWLLEIWLVLASLRLPSEDVVRATLQVRHV